ncbi:hypothetical protein F2Q70_00036392 [Brassica cretica]|uniref:Uncharacterized protein n=1 Tax=Brassica cretica TaxID=69181 RepID=A0A8S9JS83_BRACR|nr:hypothetical protein F2Q70_00036392 [Brassica cretica]
MKELLYEEYVKGAGDEIWNQIRVYTNPKPRRLILATRPNRKVKKAPPKDPSLLKHLSGEDALDTRKQRHTEGKIRRYVIGITLFRRHTDETSPRKKLFGNSFFLGNPSEISDGIPRK